MPCSHCRECGHNIRTCPILKNRNTSQDGTQPVRSWAQVTMENRPKNPPAKKKSSPMKKVSFLENVNSSCIEIPKCNIGRKVKYSPARPRPKSGKSKTILKIYCLAFQGNEKAINIVDGWKKYC